MTTYALITAIEGDGKSLNEKLNIVKQPRLFEAEAIKCFTAWRENGGWLKDIPIYTICPTKNTISEETKKALHKLNVTYIEEYMPVTETFTSGFLNIPLAGSIFESRLSEDILIKIDLDMNLIKPLPKELVHSSNALCGQYDDYCTAQQRSVQPGWANPFDTGFTISRRESGFFKVFFNTVMDVLENGDIAWEDVKKVSGDYYLEEYVMDKIFNSAVNNELNIKPIQRYQIGEWYTPVDNFSDDELVQVYFWHEHIIYDPHYDKMREKIAYFKRMKAIDDKQ